MTNKWTSRKFWQSVVGEVAGLITLFYGVGQAEKFSIIAGAIVIIAVTLGYLKAEKDIDVARAKKE